MFIKTNKKCKAFEFYMFKVINKRYKHRVYNNREQTLSYLVINVFFYTFLATYFKVK